MTAQKKTAKTDAKKAETETVETVETVETATTAIPGYEDVIAFHKDNFDAVVEASNIWMTGLQSLSATWGTFASKSVEQSVASTKALMTCTTIEDVMSLNSETAKSSYDAAVAETQTMHEISIKLAETSAKPLASRVNETVAQFSKLAA